MLLNRTDEFPPSVVRSIYTDLGKPSDMAVNPAGSSDPASERRAEYDYMTNDGDSSLVRDLEEIVSGDVRFDSYSRELYATDASAYEVTPIGVVFPRSTADVRRVVKYCAENAVPVLPRGGGTSLAGQAVNEAVVLDFTRYMDSVVEVDYEDRTLTAQPGVYLGDINRGLAEEGLKFAPDPAWADKSTLGGAIGNNSTGSHSLKYEKTDAYIESVEVVLADGSVTTFNDVTVDEVTELADGTDRESAIYTEVNRILEEEMSEIKDRYPALKRNVSGYNLDCLVEEAESGVVNIGRLLAGSEGTLGIITEATVSLEPVPNTTAVALLTYGDLIQAMEDVAPILGHEPAAVEVMDNVLLDLAAETEEFGDVVSVLPDGTDSVLLVEFYAESESAGRDKLRELLSDRYPSHSLVEEATGNDTSSPVIAQDALVADNAEEREQFWKMRKSGLPILLSRTTDEKHISFIEDCAVPPEHLPAYVEEFQAILETHGTTASFYAHAGPGVLHVRPLINTKTVEGVERMESIADAVTDLIVEYDGSVSGEHGDGRARTQWNKKLYGDRLWGTFTELKTAFDQEWIFNPGQVCGEVEMTENLRFSPSYSFDAGFEPSLNWEQRNGFQGMAELCHGCGGCRGPQETTGGVMCPTFRASREEITSTRGRANMLRQAMSGDLPAEEVFSDEFITEVMDLCIGCKGCAKDCPSEVDMAKMKVEVLNEYHSRHGASVRDWVFANIGLIGKLGSMFAPMSNIGQSVPGSRWVLEKTLGIARERSLPRFHSESFIEWFEQRGPMVSLEAAERKVVVVPDPFITFNYPAAGKATVRVLESLGVHVDVLDEVRDSGRPAYSKGFVDLARENAVETIRAVEPYVSSGWDVVVVEPSDAVMVQSDYRDLLGESSLHGVPNRTFGVCEYLDVTGLKTELDEEIGSNRRVTYHGHCHQKATNRDGHAASVLRAVGFQVDHLDSGCCGMAGSFGYEAEHYSMSRAIGEILFDQIDASSGEEVVATGASCRTQIGDGMGQDPVHPIELIAPAVE